MGRGTVLGLVVPGDYLHGGLIVDSSVRNAEMSHTSVGGNATGGGLNPNRQRGV